jgi:acetyl esterase/lipase
MALQVDPEVAQAMAKLAEAGFEAAPVGDWKARREMIDGLVVALGEGLPTHEDVTVTSHRVPVAGVELELLQYVAPGARPAAAVVYLHGGGMIGGSLAAYDRIVRNYAAQVPEATFLAVEYRLAPEHPHPTPVEDCYAALRWTAEHAGDLGIDPDRIAVAGDSAGGGLAAGVALLARDRGPRLAAQVLIYPMLDDRSTVAGDAIAPHLMWTVDDNITGWGALLGDAAGCEGVPSAAAPARAADLAGLPATFVDVGQLDLFCLEDIDYARRLAAAGVPVELHVRPGVPHAFEGLAPAAEVSQRAQADRVRFLRELAAGDAAS